MIARPSILFVCRDNAGLSLMAEAVAMHVSARVRAFSAAVGTPAPVDGAALEALHHAHIPADGLSSKPVELFALSGAPRVDLVVTLVDEAHRAARRLPWMHLMRLRTWHFEDVARQADPQARRVGYRRLLPDLRAAVSALLVREDGFASAA